MLEWTRKHRVGLLFDRIGWMIAEGCEKVLEVSSLGSTSLDVSYEAVMKDVAVCTNKRY